MKKIMPLIAVLFVCLCCPTLSAQTELKLLDGKQLRIEDHMMDTASSIFYYKLKLPSGKIKTRSVLQDNAFCYRDSLGIQYVLYSPVGDYDLSIMEMRHYIIGYGAATRDHHPWWIMAGGFAVGAGGMMVSKNPIFNPIISVAYVASIALIKPNRDRIIYEHPDFEADEDYIYAYQQAAKNKNLKYAIIGAAEGAIVGALIGIFTGYYN
ncbi:MAG: hypothetical protein R6V32_05490 [Bacteroidales bacterium]